MLQHAQALLDVLHTMALVLGYFVLTVWVTTIIFLIGQVIREIHFDHVQKRKDEDEWLDKIRSLNEEMRTREHILANQSTDSLYKKDELENRLYEWARVLASPIIPTQRNHIEKENHK